VDFLTAGMSFFVVAFGGILIGAIWAIITGFTTKYDFFRAIHTTSSHRAKCH
jgi:hypothetical protein